MKRQNKKVPKKTKYTKLKTVKSSSKKKSYKQNTKQNYKAHIDITDKSILEFKKNKSISIISKSSDLKTSKIGELYEVKPIYDNMNRICSMKIQSKTEKNNPIPKNITKQLCNCLFEKNKKITVAELEERINKKEDTPASACITILDNYYNKNKKHSVSSGNIKSNRTSRNLTV